MSAGPDRPNSTCLAFALAAAAVATGSCTGSRAGPASRPHVLLVTIDTLRADRLGCYGHAAAATPTLDSLAARGVRFQTAVAHVPLTGPSHASILSGTYPQYHRVNDFGVPLPESVPWLPDLLAARGYRTAAFVGSLILDPRNGTAPGFDRGFAQLLRHVAADGVGRGPVQSDGADGALQLQPDELTHLVALPRQAYLSRPGGHPTGPPRSAQPRACDQVASATGCYNPRP